MRDRRIHVARILDARSTPRADAVQDRPGAEHERALRDQIRLVRRASGAWGRYERQRKRDDGRCESDGGDEPGAGAAARDSDLALTLALVAPQPHECREQV